MRPNPVDNITLNQAAKLDSRQQLKQARENAFRDAESFEDIIHVIERLGCLLLGRIGDLGKYKANIKEVALASALAVEIPEKHGEVHTDFCRLYDIVTEGRNDALHQGAIARHLNNHAIELALILEDALQMNGTTAKVSDFMVRNPVCAEMWQPISYVRQQMLVNSYSYLPVKNEDVWYLLSDLDVATYLLNAATPKERKEQLAKPLGETSIVHHVAQLISSDMLISEAITKCTEVPLLVQRTGTTNDVIGILTAFDLL